MIFCRYKHFIKTFSFDLTNRTVKKWCYLWNLNLENNIIFINAEIYMFRERTYCGELSSQDIGKELTLCGWVDKNRDHGGIVFLVMRDITGSIQVVFDSSMSEENTKVADSARSEYVLYVKGTVRKRSDEAINPEIPNGDIEVVGNVIEILNKSEVTPFPIDTRDNINEEIRLKYRFLDLRREEMQQTVIARHKLMQSIRNYLSNSRFLEIETPMLNKSTPEGARDFLVPSRMNKGEFYALPQSPQLFKQILMVSGYDRYFQIVKCFRDEDLRNDRQPEFTQVDLEMSFVDEDMVMDTVEGLLKKSIKDVLDVDITDIFPKMTYKDSMDRYGTDAPDTRFAMELTDCSDIFTESEFKVFSGALKSGGIIKAFVVEDGTKITRKMIDDYTEDVKVYGAKGFPNYRVRQGKLEGGMSKFIAESEREKLAERLAYSDDCVVFFSVDKPSVVNATLASMRKKIASDIGLIDENKYNFLWVTDFPVFEYNDEDKRFYAKHHPFTSPKADQVDKLNNLTPENVDSLTARAYDVVLNGVEIGGGSIRISDQDMQNTMFEALGISSEEAEEKFSFLLDALKFGAPPHGGLALGLDRILMLIQNKQSIRDVIPFPKTQKGQCLMSEAPSGVDKKQLKELGLRIVEKQQ